MLNGRHFIVEFIAVLGLALVAADTSAAPGRAEPTACISPSGLDLHERYGVSEEIVAPFCTQIVEGRRWRVAQAWVMARTFEKLPKGFTPAKATPLEDFLAKLKGVRYVIDPGTPREQTIVVRKNGKLAVDPDINGFAVVNALTLTTLKPLPVGEHVIATFWSLDAMHCDGLGKVPAKNCLPAGDSLYETITFTVAPK